MRKCEYTENGKICDEKVTLCITKTFSFSFRNWLKINELYFIRSKIHVNSCKSMS